MSVCERGHQCRTTVSLAAWDRTSQSLPSRVQFSQAGLSSLHFLLLALNVSMISEYLNTCKQYILDGILVFEIVSEASCKKFISVCVGDNLSFLV
jgi:hypothetical protein